jgi:hypothetical protein
MSPTALSTPAGQQGARGVTSQAVTRPSSGSQPNAGRRGALSTTQS